LNVPAAGVRPTQDRVREALFSMLAGRVQGCRFLDLFAGSGAVGIEAWSRGASEVWWVEADARARRALESNLRDLGIGEGRVIGMRTEAFLKHDPAPGGFDIIFADPPYRGQGPAGESWPALVARAARRDTVLKPGGLLVVEQRVSGDAVAPAGWRVLRDRRYGATRLLCLEKEEGA
jgi:16S rRNA (guanine966-N2)-methyltransferase